VSQIEVSLKLVSLCFRFRSDGTESPLLEQREESSPADKHKQVTKYGELTILG